MQQVLWAHTSTRQQAADTAPESVFWGKHSFSWWILQTSTGYEEDHAGHGHGHGWRNLGWVEKCIYVSTQCKFMLIINFLILSETAVGYRLLDGKFNNNLYIQKLIPLSCNGNGKNLTYNKPS